ncbi:hypothetical protein HPB50_020723 [Hyalomma asiaticum]|uniref:Uncharacterized protein n=1 Tax=Hyalomma asiaticum TaxID=266040 RepID=A0ACB7TMY0_HYAAI|nr:hypothetical protein HPB50_020723 [Hyalomma asiaticum]
MIRPPRMHGRTLGRFSSILRRPPGKDLTGEVFRGRLDRFAQKSAPAPLRDAKIDVQNGCANFVSFIDRVGVWDQVLKPVEYLTDRFLRFVDYSELRFYQERDVDVEKCCVEQLEIRRLVKHWVEFQDSQRILVTTPSVLVGYRVKVYRAEGTTQWYTAVIVSYNDSTRAGGGREKRDFFGARCAAASDPPDEVSAQSAAPLGTGAQRHALKSVALDSMMRGNTGWIVERDEETVPQVVPTRAFRACDASRLCCFHRSFVGVTALRNDAYKVVALCSEAGPGSQPLPGPLPRRSSRLVAPLPSTWWQRRKNAHPASRHDAVSASGPPLLLPRDPGRRGSRADVVARGFPRLLEACPFRTATVPAYASEYSMVACKGAPRRPLARCRGRPRYIPKSSASHPLNSDPPTG